MIKIWPVYPVNITKHQDQILTSMFPFILLLVLSGPPLSSPWSRGGGWRFPLEPLVNQLEVSVRNQMYFSSAVSLILTNLMHFLKKDEIDWGWRFPLEPLVCQLEVLLISCFSPAIFFSLRFSSFYIVWQCSPTMLITFSQLNVLSSSCFSHFLPRSSNFPCCVIWNLHLGIISWTFPLKRIYNW